MRPHKSHRKEEGLLVLSTLLQELDGLVRGHRVSHEGSVFVGHLGHCILAARLAYHLVGLSFRIGFLPAFPLFGKNLRVVGIEVIDDLAWRHRFHRRGVVALVPGGFVIAAIRSFENISRNPHVIDLAHARRPVAVILKMLRHCDPLRIKLPAIAVHPVHIWVLARH